MHVCVCLCMRAYVCVCVCVGAGLSPSGRFCRGGGLTVPGGTLMSHGNSDVMEAQPRLDLCVQVCV